MTFNVNCTKFDQLIRRKIIQIVVTSCHSLSLKCIKFDFGWGTVKTLIEKLTAPPVVEAPPDLLAGFEEPTSKRRGRMRKGGEGNGRGRGE